MSSFSLTVSVGMRDYNNCYFCKIISVATITTHQLSELPIRHNLNFGMDQDHKNFQVQSYQIHMYTRHSIGEEINVWEVFVVVFYCLVFVVVVVVLVCLITTLYHMT